MSYDYTTSMEFVKEHLGEAGVRRQWPRIDRLITLWMEYRHLADWLEENSGQVGTRDYKENVTALNGLMQNIRNLENDLNLFSEEGAKVKHDDSFLKTMGLMPDE